MVEAPLPAHFDLFRADIRCEGHCSNELLFSMSIEVQLAGSIGPLTLRQTYALSYTHVNQHELNKHRSPSLSKGEQFPFIAHASERIKLHSKYGSNALRSCNILYSRHYSRDIGPRDEINEYFSAIKTRSCFLGRSGTSML